MSIAQDKSSTVGASSLDRLTGQNVRLWPYVPGVYGRDMLYRVWKAMEEDGSTRLAFWDETDPATGADLASFVRAFENVPRRLLLLIEGVETQHLIGCFWLSEITIGHQAFASMWMQKSARGPRTDEAAKMALAYSFESFGLTQLWAITPWALAAALCRRMGFVRSARLPRFCKADERFHDVMVYLLTKERFHAVGQ